MSYLHVQNKITHYGKEIFNSLGLNELEFEHLIKLSGEVERKSVSKVKEEEEKI